MAYGDIEDLARRIAAGIQYYKTAFNIAKTPKYDGCQRGLASTVYKFFFDKKRPLGVVKIGELIQEIRN